MRSSLAFAALCAALVGFGAKDAQAGKGDDTLRGRRGHDDCNPGGGNDKLVGC